MMSDLPACAMHFFKSISEKPGKYVDDVVGTVCIDDKISKAKKINTTI
jgi:hypothetical protein